MAEFDDHGFQAVKVDDIVRRAQISHGTFYLYFASKEDLFKTLVQDALRDMAIVAEEFPFVTRDTAGQAALLSWVHSFCRTYDAHSTVLWIITRTQVEDADIYSPGLQLFFRLSEIMAERMTAFADHHSSVPSSLDAGNTGGIFSARSELTGLLCLLMLEGVNALINADVPLPRDSMAERISDIIYAAFAGPSPQAPLLPAKLMRSGSWRLRPVSEPAQKPEGALAQGRVPEESCTDNDERYHYLNDGESHAENRMNHSDADWESECGDASGDWPPRITFLSGRRQGCRENVARHARAPLRGSVPVPSSGRLQRGIPQSRSLTGSIRLLA